MKIVFQSNSKMVMAEDISFANGTVETNVIELSNLRANKISEVQPLWKPVRITMTDSRLGDVHEMIAEFMYEPKDPLLGDYRLSKLILSEKDRDQFREYKRVVLYGENGEVIEDRFYEEIGLKNILEQICAYIYVLDLKSGKYLDAAGVSYQGSEDLVIMDNRLLSHVNEFCTTAEGVIKDQNIFRK